MDTINAIKIINIYNITLIFKFQQYTLYLYWKEEKINAIILNLYNNLNLITY